MALQIAGTLFAAVSFSAANLAFKYIDPSDYSKESHRHNLGMEKFAKEHEAWSKQNILNEEKIKQLELEKHNADINFIITNKNLEDLKKNKKMLPNEPKLKDYYHPSDKMQNYKHATSGILGFAGAYGATKIIRPSSVI